MWMMLLFTAFRRTEMAVFEARNGSVYKIKVLILAVKLYTSMLSGDQATTYVIFITYSCRLGE
jgi:hypothetical protein